MFKTSGYNLVVPVLEYDGKYYIQNHKDESMYKLINMAENVDKSLKDAWIKKFLEFQEKDEKKYRKYL